MHPKPCDIMKTLICHIKTICRKHRFMKTVMEEVVLAKCVFLKTLMISNKRFEISNKLRLSKEMHFCECLCEPIYPFFIARIF